MITITGENVALLIIVGVLGVLAVVALVVDRLNKKHNK